jgi:DnaJ-domain-containing protein 1
VSLFRRFGRILTSQLRDLPFRRDPVQPVSSNSDAWNGAEDTSSASSPSQEEQYRANLEVGPHANLAEIRLSYKRLMKQYHPDFHATDLQKREMAHAIAQRLNEAMDYFESLLGKGV